MNPSGDRLRELLAPASTRTEDFTSASALELLETASTALEDCGLAPLSVEEWKQFLAVTRHPRFLAALPHDKARTAWAECTFAITEGIEFKLGDLLDQRAEEMPDRVLFQDLKEAGAGSWTYHQVRRRARANAAIFLSEGIIADRQPEAGLNDGRPRVALLCENGIGSACCDLACLTHDIFITPLNIHFNTENLVWIFDRLDITTAVCDNADHLEKLLAIREKSRRYFKIFRRMDYEKNKTIFTNGNYRHICTYSSRYQHFCCRRRLW